MNINSWVQGEFLHVKVELKVHAIQINMCAHECRGSIYCRFYCKFNICATDFPFQLLYGTFVWAFLLLLIFQINNKGKEIWHSYFKIYCLRLFVKRLRCNCLPVAGSKVLKQNQFLWPMVCSRWHFICLFMTDVHRKATYKNQIKKSVPLVLKNNVKYITVWHTLCCLKYKLAKVVRMK